MIDEKLKKLSGITGEIYAAEPLNGQAPAKNGFIAEYSKGVEVYNVDETNRDAWLANGHNDSMPYLHRLIYQRSSIHNSAINIKANLIAGGGLEYTPLQSYYKKNEEGFFELVEESLSETAGEGLIKQAKLFEKNVLLDSYRKKSSSQMALYGGYYGFRTYMLDRMAKTMLRRLYIEPYINMRLGAKRSFVENEFKSQNHYISDDWTSATPYGVHKYSDLQRGQKKLFRVGNVYRIPSDDGLVYQRNGKGTFSKFIGRITDYRSFYATPDYESLDALTYMDIDYMMSQRDFKDLESGFSLEYIVVRYRAKKATDSEEKEQRKKDVKFFKDNYRGFNGDRTLMLWANPVQDETGKVQTPKLIDVIPIPNTNTPERYNVLREERLMKILNAHCIVSGEIIGLPRLNATGFSSQSEYLITAQEQLYWSSIKPAQDIILEDIQQILLDAGIPVKPTIIKSTANFRALTEKLLMWAWGKNEVREMHGSQEMTEEVAEEVMNRVTVVENENKE